MFVILLLFCTSLVFSLENLGVHGHVYRVEEKNIIEEIKERARRVKPPDVEKMIKKAAQMNVELPVAKELKVHRHSIIYTVPQDIVVGGRLIARKGEKINVLQRIRLHRIYVVLNDYMVPQFLDFARRYPNTVFLVAKGNVYELDRKYKDFLFYGALPQIVKALKVEAVPSIVYQNGDKLIVVEVPWVEGKALLPF